eukprot:GHVU01097769.1.p1 GENE.GHVU01097769.1~~GHVU01097769.1.p1  ORF type:complete len:204 (+),score=19.38 GHVU01097769.1:297-908(+)
MTRGGVRWSPPRRPPARRRKETWQDVIKFWFDRKFLTAETLLERLETQDRQAQEEAPRPEGLETVGLVEASGSQLSSPPPPPTRKVRRTIAKASEHVWSCSRCGYIIRGDSVVRLRQHLLGRFVLPQDRHTKVRMCAKIEPQERDDLKADLGPLLRGSASAAAGGGDVQVELLSATPDPYTRLTDPPAASTTTPPAKGGCSTL